MLKRLILLSALLLAFGYGASFLAGQGGDSTIEWLGFKVEVRTSLLVTSMLCLLFLLMMLDRLLSYLVMLPGRLSQRIRLRRQKEGERAVALGLVAAAIGDGGEAAKQARRAHRLTGASTLTGLLDAQIATLKGDTDAARSFFDSLTDNRATAWLGHAGVMRLKAEAGDDGAALEAGRAAFANRRSEPGLARALFALEVREGNWGKAIDALQVALRHSKSAAERKKAKTAMAVLYYQLAQQRLPDGKFEDGMGDLADIDSTEALKNLEKSLKHDPGLVPAALQAGLMLLEGGKKRKATTLLEKAFLESPHPDLAACLIESWPNNETANLARLMRLADKGGNRPEAVSACASIALQLQLWGEAKRLAERVPEGKRDALIWATLAEVGRNPPEGAHSDWPVVEDCLGRAAAAPRSAGWTCGQCGSLTDLWQPHCPQCEGFATLEWRR